MFEYARHDGSLGLPAAALRFHVCERAQLLWSVAISAARVCAQAHVAASVQLGVNLDTVPSEVRLLGTPAH